MSYHIEKLVDEPIILDILNSDCRLSVEGQSNLNELLPLLESESAPVYLILDFSAVSFDVTEIVQGASLVGKYYGVFKHRNVRELVSVIDRPFVKAAAEGLNNPLFGSLAVHICPSLAAALEYVRARIAG